MILHAIAVVQASYRIGVKVKPSQNRSPGCADVLSCRYVCGQHCYCMRHKVYFRPRAKGTSEDLGAWRKTPSVSSGVGLVHTLHDWERYKDPVEYRNMSHSHCISH